MPHDRPFTTLFLPDQALTAEQAADWVRGLIDYYSQSVSALYHDTLPEEALHGYSETLRSLLECAGALEQHLCGMCFFLPDQLSRTVVAIIVAIYYQSALLDAFIEDPFEGNICVIVDEETLENMSLYMRRVATHIDTLCDWLASERYVMLQGIAKKTVFEMRTRIASANGSPGRRDTTPSCVTRNPRLTRAKSKAPEIPFARLDSFLRRLSPDHFSGDHSSSSSTTVELPFSPLDAIPDLSPVAGPSSPAPSTPSPFHMSLPEWVLDHHQEVESERRHSLTSSDTTCVEEPTLGSPFYLEANVRSSPKETAGHPLCGPAPDACEPPPIRPNLKRRRRTTSTLTPSSTSFSSETENHRRKRRRQITLRTFGPDGAAEDIETETDTHMRAYVGRAVPVPRAPPTGHASESPMSLPSRNLSISPNTSQASASTLMRARSLSPLGLGLGLGLTLVPPPSVSGREVPALWYGADSRHEASDGIEVDAGSEGGESDGESFATADDRLHEDVWMEDEDERAASGSSPDADLSRKEEAHAENDEDKVEDAAPDVPSSTSSPPPPPVLSRKAKGKRRCFADIFRTFRHIIHGR